MIDPVDHAAAIALGAASDARDLADKVKLLEARVAQLEEQVRQLISNSHARGQ